MDAGDQERAPLAAFLVSVGALSVLYTWFSVVTDGSLLIALLLHSATNTAAVVHLKDARSDFGPVIVATVLTVVLAAVAARHLERPRPSEGEEDCHVEDVGGDGPGGARRRWRRWRCSCWL
jgi:hypothetical protein